MGNYNVFIDVDGALALFFYPFHENLLGKLDTMDETIYLLSL